MEHKVNSTSTYRFSFSEVVPGLRLIVVIQRKEKKKIDWTSLQDPRMVQSVCVIVANKNLLLNEIEIFSCITITRNGYDGVYSNPNVPIAVVPITVSYKPNFIV